MRGFTFALALSLAAGTVLAAPPPAGPRPDRSRMLAGWRIESVAEEDGGRLVRMRRVSAGYHLQFQAAFWRGNAGRIQATLVEYSDCTNGEEIGRDARPGLAAIRSLLAGHLRDCGASPARIATALRGIEPAYRLASAWIDEAEAATAAEAEAIANYGRE